MTAYNELTTQKDKIAFLKDKLATNDKWAVRGMLRIYDLQTAEEQSIGNTVENNGVGFNGVDSTILTSMSQQYIRKHVLSVRQMNIIHKIMTKYAKQLMNIADGTIKIL